MFQLFKDFVINSATGWVEFEGEVVSADEIASQTITLSPQDVMALAKNGGGPVRLIDLNEAAGRKYRR